MSRINTFQLKLDTRVRLFCITRDKTIYPLIIDLKHCISKIDNNKKNSSFHKVDESTEWNYKSVQNQIKQRIQKLINK